MVIEIVLVVILILSLTVFAPSYVLSRASSFQVWNETPVKPYSGLIILQRQVAYPAGIRDDRLRRYGEISLYWQ
jgi:hypothetical protein